MSEVPEQALTREKSNLWEPEVEPDASERPHRGPQGCYFEIHPEDSNGVPPFTQRQETVHPPEMAIAYLDIGGRGDYPPEPSIRNIEVWLDWQAHQLNMPHWWMEITAIPDVEKPKRLAQKICTSFSIRVVRCETFPGQEYTAPLPPNVSPGIYFSPTFCPIRTFDSSLCC